MVYDDYEQAVIDEVQAELDANDPVVRTITYRRFVSKSKGIRNGKRRVRRRWKEVRLVKYRDRPFRSWHRFPFDEYATEIFGQQYSKEDAEEALREAIKNRWGY